MQGALNVVVDSFKTELEEFKSRQDTILSQLAAVMEDMQELKGEFAVYKKAVTQGSVVVTTEPRIDVPKPKVFDGARKGA
ncbi:hypothetical protein Tsubulata_018561 [Turnera subulata]|uniref:Uncharacterized protein n=1 Tax=Turnera subulata TaxID=218843 RepID=A0A9Q0F0G6_9ROSI|nr:hypothetical protein Tsubulata_018561 [Turnera subulata]